MKSAPRCSRCDKKFHNAVKHFTFMLSSGGYPIRFEMRHLLSRIWWFKIMHLFFEQNFVDLSTVITNSPEYKINRNLT